MLKSTTTKWKIHIGAHKTAITDIQNIAETKREALHSQGIDYLSRSDLRKCKALAKPGSLNWRHKLNGKFLKSAFYSRIKPLRRGCDTVVISEDNFLGWSTGLLGSDFYSPTSEYLNIISALSEETEVSVFLSIRPQVEIIPSAYIEVIRTQALQGGFERLKKEIIENPPSWLSLVRVLKSNLPNVKISVWTMKDYLQNKNAVLSHFFGIDFPDFEDIKAPINTKSLSAEAISKIELINTDVPAKKYKRQASDIIKNDQGDTKFSPFNDSERMMLAKQYYLDIQGIKKEFPGVLFEI